MEMTQDNKINHQTQDLLYSLSGNPRDQVLLSPYARTVKEFMLAMIEARYNYEDNNELCSMAIQATDKLIEKVNHKLMP
ncbi:MAG: hypothetical protein AAFQ80_19205 [Cyanobacteria bacterium J06621_8]